MKKILILIIALSIGTFSYSQNDTIPSPEYNFNISYLNQGKLVNLEKSEYKILGKSNGLGVGYGGVYLEGKTSNCNVKLASRSFFIVRFPEGTDPSEQYDLIAFEIKGKQRQIILDKYNGWTKKHDRIYKKIPFEITKIKPQVYQFTVYNLPVGQYFFGSEKWMYAFGVE